MNTENGIVPNIGDLISWYPVEYEIYHKHPFAVLCQKPVDGSYPNDNNNNDKVRFNSPRGNSVEMGMILIVTPILMLKFMVKK